MGLALLLLAELVGSAAEQHWCLVDQGTADGEFADFRLRFLAAVVERDLEAVRRLSLYELFVETERHTFDQLVEIYIRPSGSGPSSWWQLAEEALQGGGILTAGTFCAPFVSCEAAPEADLADLTELFVLQPDTPLYASAAAERAPLALLPPCERLRVRRGSVSDWMAVTLQDGTSGFVRSAAVRARGDMTFRFARVDGRWRFGGH